MQSRAPTNQRRWLEELRETFRNHPLPEWSLTGENDARALEKNAAKAVRAIAERVIDIDDEWPVVLGTALRWFFEQSSFGAGVSPYIAPAFEEIPTATRVDRYAAAVAKDVVGQMARTYG